MQTTNTRRWYPLARMSFASISAIILLLGAGAAVAGTYTGATISQFDIQSSDLTGLTGPIRAFPVPAASGMAGANLIYDNYAEGIPFSPSYYTGGAVNSSNPNLSCVTMPVHNSAVAMEQVGNYDYTTPGNYDTPLDPSTVTFDDTIPAVVNDESTPIDPRFPSHIPRLGSYGDYFFGMQFTLTTPAKKFGLFLPASTNAPYNKTSGIYYDDSNNVLASADVVDVLVQGVGQPLSDAQVTKISLSNEYCPFVEIDWNGTTPIQAVTVIQDGNIDGKPPLGFMDAYSIAVPEPGTMSLLALGGLAMLRRRRR